MMVGPEKWDPQSAVLIYLFCPELFREREDDPFTAFFVGQTQNPI